MVFCVNIALHSYLNYPGKYFTLILCVHVYVCVWVQWQMPVKSRGDHQIPGGWSYRSEWASMCVRTELWSYSRAALALNWRAISTAQQAFFKKDNCTSGAIGETLQSHLWLWGWQGQHRYLYQKSLHQQNLEPKSSAQSHLVPGCWNQVLSYDQKHLLPDHSNYYLRMLFSLNFNTRS